MYARKSLPKKDPRGGHIRLYWEIVDSNAWKALSWGQRGLYVALRRKLLSTNNGNIEAPLSILRHDGVTSSASLASGIRALEAVGLIARTRTGGFSQGKRVCNLFRFTDHDVYEHPKLGIAASLSTNEWRGFRTVAQARGVIDAAHAAAKTGVPRAYPVRRKNAGSIQRAKPTSSMAEQIAS